MATESLLQLALGCLSAIGGILLAGVGFLYREAKRAGARESKLDSALTKLDRIEGNLEKVTEHDVRIGQLEDVVTVIRSDVKHLVRGSRDWSSDR